jgi:hypothetical protein
MGKSPSVGIIGAGISALRCADILIQNGVQVTLLEARGRIGGRICQAKVGGHLMDVGPNWIHGTDSNPIANIALGSNTKLHEWDESQSIFNPSGDLCDDALATKITEWMWTIIEEAFEYSNKYKDIIPAHKSLSDFFREKIEETDFTQEEKDMCIELSKTWGAYVGDPVERQSLKFFRLEECIDGNNFFVASTYKNILEHISGPVVRRADIRLNEPVVKIEALRRASATKHQVAVTTAAGKRYHFDEVVVTCPLGWLKRNKSAFVPEIPARLSSAIDSISYGGLEKIYAVFPHAFWDSTSSINNNHSPPPPFTHFLNPTYVEHAESTSWNQECISLSALPAGCAHPTLLFYIFGPSAAYIVSKIKTLDPSSETYYNFLNDFLLPYYSRLPQYSSSSPDCKPASLFATQWRNDPYAGNGSYSNFQVGLERGDEDIEVMREGMGIDRGIWFAGEHTAPFVGLGTTTGAYWSGERAAGQICDIYNLSRSGMGLKRDDSLPSAIADASRVRPKVLVPPVVVTGMAEGQQVLNCSY